ncbi:hypothetical protein DV515_00015920 [Chloebia gouldiae]|uniref:Uncharacterized protein n=1 Tax=Chloebia gouldiae TaxID=44316 RepID=A0A3L8RTS3_CHLGU|nr:hypothetical protein DV515_00015920 [Chloebia gouldiae]
MLLSKALSASFELPGFPLSWKSPSPTPPSLREASPKRSGRRSSTNFTPEQSGKVKVHILPGVLPTFLLRIPFKIGQPKKQIVPKTVSKPVPPF